MASTTVQALDRRRMPFWAMSTLSLLPIWGLLYVRALTPEAKQQTGPMAAGEAVYRSCSGCHGPDGEGGAGRPLSNGAVLRTFPSIEQQLNFVYTGSRTYEEMGFATFGDPAREGGAHRPGYDGKGAYMPAQGQGAGGDLTDAEILAVVCHERYALSDGELTSPEFARWCDSASTIYADLESRTTSFAELEGVGTTHQRPG